MTTPAPDRIERAVELEVPPTRLWRALTDHAEFGMWFGVHLESPFSIGQTTRGRITHPGYEHLVMEIRTRQMQPEHLFAFCWHPYAVDPKIDYSSEPPTLVEFHLTPASRGTHLAITESGFTRIPAHRREEAYRMNAGGWTEQIKNIKRYLERADASA